MPFGIDFGTTNSTTVEWLNKLPLHHSESAGKPFPSLVAIDKITGAVVARGLAVREKRNSYNIQCEVITSPKTHLGTDWSQRIGGNLWTAKDIAREIFVGLRDIVSERSNLDEAVVAIPVGFSPRKRKELRQAAHEAGIKVRNFVSEPTAALFRNIAKVERWQKVVVFDWGGGTLDITLLQLDRGENVTEIAAMGVPLGGDDLDLKIAQYVYKEFQLQTGSTVPLHELDSASKDMLSVACEHAKCQLSNKKDYTILIPNFSNKKDLYVFLDRNLLMDLIGDAYKKALDSLRDVVSAKAGMSYKDIGCILMVGGSSKLVGLHSRIQEEAGNCVVIPPDEDADWQVAHGAAMLSSSSGTYLLAGNLGIELSDRSVFPIATHGMPYSNCAGSLNFGIVEDNETAIFNFIRLSGDSQNLALAKIRERVGTVLVSCNGFVNESIRMKYAIDNDLTLSVVIDSNTYGELRHTPWEYDNLLFTYDLPAK